MREHILLSYGDEEKRLNPWQLATEERARRNLAVAVKVTRAIFVDTGYVIALLNTSDAHHDAAKRWQQRLQAASRPLVTTTAVLLELPLRPPTPTGSAPPRGASDWCDWCAGSTP